MSDPQFNQPGAASGDKLELDKYIGRLLLIYPKEVKVGVSTSGFGLKDPLVADIVVLETGEELHDAFIFPGVLIGQLKGYIGNPNPALGRLTKGVPKAGQAAPWMLDDFTPQDAALASQWVNTHPRGFNNPNRQQPPAQQAAGYNGYNGGAPAGGLANGSYADTSAAAAALEQQRAAAAQIQTQMTQQQPPAAPAGVNTQTGEITTPAAPPGGVNVATVRTLLNLAIPDHEIAANTGATLEQIQAIRNLPVS